MKPCSGRRMQPKGSPGVLVPARARRGTRTPKWCTNGRHRAAACRKPEKKRAADASRTQAAPTLGWDASLSATPRERFTENRQLHRRLRHLLLRDRGRGAGRQAADDGAANGYARPAPPRQTSTPLPTGQKTFKVRGLDSPIARVLGHSRTGMLGMGTRHGLPRQALRRSAPAERLRTQPRPHISLHLQLLAGFPNEHLGLK